MRVTPIRIVITALVAFTAFGQPAADRGVDRVLYYTNAKTVQDIQEIATLVRALADVPQVNADTEQRSLSLHGTADQIALAEWLLQELDQPLPAQPAAQQNEPPRKHEYRIAGSGEPLVRVFYLPHAQTLQELQEAATLIRSIGEIRRVFTYNAPRAMALRGTAEQVALAEWLVQELDTNRQATRTADPAAHEFRMSPNGDDIVRVFYLTHTDTVQHFQQIITQVRSMTGTRRVFTFNAPRAAAFRGTLDQIAQAERLIQERDQ